MRLEEARQGAGAAMLLIRLKAERFLSSSEVFGSAPGLNGVILECHAEAASAFKVNII